MYGNHDDEAADFGEICECQDCCCVWCGEPGCPGYDCNVEDYNIRDDA